MTFDGTDSYCDIVKRVSSLSQTKKSTFDQREEEYFRLRLIGAQNVPIRLRITKASPIHKSSKRAAAFFQSTEDLDLDKQFGTERCFDDKESMWLSSDCSSPSAFFREYRWSDSCHPSVDELLLPSWLSLLAITNPMDEASNLRIQRTFPDEEKNIQRDVKDENVVTWLLSSVTNDPNARDSSVTHSESVESCEDSTSCGNSSTPLSTESSCFEILDSERTGYQVSLLNLDGDDYRLIPDTDPGFDCLPSDFPSPSYKSGWDHEVWSSMYGVSTAIEAQTAKSGYGFSSELASEVADLEDLNTDEPLFWPFERKVDWNSEATLNYFSMSPRKNIAFGTPPNLIAFRRHGRNMDFKEGCKRRLVFSSGSRASKVELKQRYNEGVRRINTLPSRLSRETKCSV